MNILGLARHGLNNFEQIAILLVVVTALLVCFTPGCCAAPS